MDLGNQSIKRGILLVNLGSPKSPKTRDVRRFLREFLGDPRVVNLPRWLWWLILNLIILPFRPRKSAHAYQSIWTDAGSPLVVFSQQLTAKLAVRYAGRNCVFSCAMRYGEPSVASQLNAFAAQNVEQVIIVPLYPQYSSTTTASVYDAVVQAFSNWRHLPSFQVISDYHQHPSYIQAVANSIRQHWQQYGQSELLLISFHGLPAKLTELGDPYFYQCQTTARLLANALALNDAQWQLVFQSRFGKAEWLKPYCVEVLQQLPEQGFKRLDVVCPGFAVDCLETLEEIAMTNQAIFIAAGGESYRYIPALNASDAHVDVINDLINNAR